MASRQRDILDTFVAAMPPGRDFPVGKLYNLLPAKGRPGYSTFGAYLRRAVRDRRIIHPRHGFYRRAEDATVQERLPEPSFYEPGNMEVFAALDAVEAKMRDIACDLALLRARLQC